MRPFVRLKCGMDLKDAIKRAGISQRQLADAVGVTEGRVSQWLSSGRIPAERCQAVSQATGVPLHTLRPDIYPPPPQPSEAA